MGMTINKIIEQETLIIQDSQRILDTHMVSECFSVEEMYCDDTEAIEDHFARCQKTIEYHSTIVTVLRKYQKIEQIIHDDWIKGINSGATLNKIEEVLENGNDD